jgi:hypothetical protein
MTGNQIAWWKLQEDIRSHQAQEALSQAGIVETRRHNVESEALTLSDLTEKGRHNLVTESQNLFDLGEKQRHNQAQESVAQWEASIHAAQQRESERHNLANETYQFQSLEESRRHNEANESNDLLGIRYNYAVSANRNLEQQRHNKAEEAEQKRHSEATEAEAARHNKRSENIDIANTVIKGVDVGGDLLAQIIKMFGPGASSSLSLDSFF